MPPYQGPCVVNGLVEFIFLIKLWHCRSPSTAIGLGQALIRVLQFSAVLAAEDQKVCSVVCNTISPGHRCLVAPKVTTLTLGKSGRRVLYAIGDPQANTLERQPTGGGKGVWFVLN